MADTSALRGGRRSVLIIPELTFNSGWLEIAGKVERLIKDHRLKNNIEEYRLTDSKIPYAEATRSFKWEKRDGKGVNEGVAMKGGGFVSIKDPHLTKNEILKISLVGEFNATTILSEVRRWSNNLWKQAHGLNIYEMGRDLFLFEFASKETAEQVMRGDWSWMQAPVKLQWWNSSRARKC